MFLTIYDLTTSPLMNSKESMTSKLIVFYSSVMDLIDKIDMYILGRLWL